MAIVFGVLFGFCSRRKIGDIDSTDTSDTPTVSFGPRCQESDTIQRLIYRHLQTEMGRIVVKCREIQLGLLFAYRRFAVDHPKLKSERPDAASTATLKTASSSPDAPHFKRLFDLKEILEKLTWQSYLKMKRGSQRNDG